MDAGIALAALARHHERIQREVALASADARRVAAGRPQHINRPERPRFFGRR